MRKELDLETDTLERYQTYIEGLYSVTVGQSGETCR